jgi:hypothetical protein
MVRGMGRGNGVGGMVRGMVGNGVGGMVSGTILSAFAVLYLNGPNIEEVFYDENGAGACQEPFYLHSRSST